MIEKIDKIEFYSNKNQENCVFMLNYFERKGKLQDKLKIIIILYYLNFFKHAVIIYMYREQLTYLGKKLLYCLKCDMYFCCM